MALLSGFSPRHWLSAAGAIVLVSGALAQQSAIEQTRQTDQVQSADPADPADPDAETAEDLLEEAEPVEIRYDRYTTATLRALDKITGRSTDIDVTVDTPVIFGALRVTLKSCHQTPPELPPESAAFLEVDGVQSTQSVDGVKTVEAGEIQQDGERLFSGWMFASSPGLSALEHPVYDIWTIRCTTSEPTTGASGG